MGPEYRRDFESIMDLMEAKRKEINEKYKKTSFHRKESLMPGACSKIDPDKLRNEFLEDKKKFGTLKLSLLIGYNRSTIVRWANGERIAHENHDNHFKLIKYFGERILSDD